MEFRLIIIKAQVLNASFTLSTDGYGLTSLLLSLTILIEIFSAVTAQPVLVSLSVKNKSFLPKHFMTGQTITTFQFKSQEKNVFSEVSSLHCFNTNRVVVEYFL